MKPLVFVVGLLASCAAITHEQPWSFVDTVGGMTVGAPRPGSHGIELPVAIDVSGLTTVTHKPLGLNSGLVCTATRARIRAHAVYLTVETGLPQGTASTVCPPAQLGAISAGTYAVYYGSRPELATRIGEIEIAR